MGREAACTCRWGDQTAYVKALLETSELILRGEIRRRVPFAEMRDLEARADRLQFKFAHEKVTLEIGSETAEKWLKIIKNPPTLAKKLGISSTTVVRAIGNHDDHALNAALAEAAAISPQDATLIVAVVDTPQSLLEALALCRPQTEDGIPLWLVYRKGPGHPLNEHMIRDIVLPTGLVDNKVAAVSPELTAIRFVRRKR
jgi:hypothetical protein